MSAGQAAAPSSGRAGWRGVGGQARVFFGLATAVLIGLIAYVGRGVIIPVIAAVFLSFLIHTLKETVKSGPLIGRFLPDWLCYLLAFVVIVSAIIFFIDIIGDNVETIVAAAPLYEARLRDLTQEGIGFLKGLGALPEDFIGGVDQLRRAGLGMINPVLSQIASSVRSLAADSVTILLYTVFMLLERGRIFRKIGLLSENDDQRAVVDATISEIGVMVRQYITMKTATNLVTATVAYFILRLIGVDFAGFWALLMFVLTYIPIVGSIIAIAAPVLLALVQPVGGGLQTALLALGLLVAAEQTMSSAIEPRLIGRSLNLSPFIVLLSLSVWGALWGFAGALLAVPMTVTLMIILTQFAATRPVAILLSDSGKIAPIRRRTEPREAAPAR